MTNEEIWKAAQNAGRAVAECTPDGGPFDCGFAWVVVRPGTCSFAKWTRSQGFSDRHYYGGEMIWYSQFSSNVQSVTVHIAAAYAFAEVLLAHGIECTVGSRLD